MSENEQQEKAKDVAVVKPAATVKTVDVPDLKPASLGNFDNLLDPARFDHIQRVAMVFAESRMVPEQYRKNLPDCIIAVQMAVRLRVDPFMFMQNTYVVHGKPGMEAKLAIALVNSRGPFTGPIQWKPSGEGDSRSMEAYAIHKETGDRCAVTVDVRMAKAEGWWQKKGSKWPTMTDLMLMYRSAMFLARLYAPECIMGMQSLDEVFDASSAAVHVEYEDVSPSARGAAAVAKLQPEEPEAVKTAPAPAGGIPDAEPVEVSKKAVKEFQEAAEQAPADEPPADVEAPEPEINADLKWIEAEMVDKGHDWIHLKDWLREIGMPKDWVWRRTLAASTPEELDTIRGLMGG